VGEDARGVGKKTFASCQATQMEASEADLAHTDRNLLFQGVLIGASVRPGLRGCNKDVFTIFHAEFYGRKELRSIILGKNPRLNRGHLTGADIRPGRVKSLFHQIANQHHRTSIPIRPTFSFYPVEFSIRHSN